MPAAQVVQANGVDLAVEAFGAAEDPAILLIMGSSGSMDWWDSELCELLAAGGRRVIRYDHRDTGESVSYPVGRPGYTGADLVEDAVGVLDALEVERARLMGISMGGALAQVAAIEHPDRVAGLILIATAPAAPGPEDPDLPTMSEEASARFAALAEPDWSDRAAVIEHIVDLERACAGRGPFDETRFRAYAEQAFDRATDIQAALTNHNAAEGSGRWRERLAEIAVPTLVIHGTADPVIPYGNGEALAREVPGARLLTLEGAGHDLPRSAWDVAVPAILELTGTAA